MSRTLNHSLQDSSLILEKGLVRIINISSKSMVDDFRQGRSFVTEETSYPHIP